MTREDLILNIKHVIKLKRAEHIKYYAFVPFVLLFFALVFLLLTAVSIYLLVFLKFHEISAFSAIFIFAVISALLFTRFIVILRYILILKKIKPDLFNIECFLADLQYEDLVLLEKKIISMKRLSKYGEFICLKNVIIVTVLDNNHCINLHELKSISYILQRPQNNTLFAATLKLKFVFLDGGIDAQNNEIIIQKSMHPTPKEFVSIMKQNPLFCEKAKAGESGPFTLNNALSLKNK